jgi:CMP-N-acetylneuraminic acid synthetase
LALDSTPMIDVVLHAMEWSHGQGERYDAVCLLQPTSPLRSAKTIDRCISALFERKVDTVISVRPVPHEYNPYWVFFETSEGVLERSIRGQEIPCRQQLPKAYHCDGSVYVVRTEVVVETHSLYGKKTVGVTSPQYEACDLDTEEQWALLERSLQSRVSESPK